MTHTKSGHLALALQVKLNFSIGRRQNFFKVINDLQDWLLQKEKAVRLRKTAPSSEESIDARFRRKSKP